MVMNYDAPGYGGGGGGGAPMVMNYDAPAYGGGGDAPSMTMNYDAPGYGSGASMRYSGGLRSASGEFSDERRPLLGADYNESSRPLVTQPVFMSQALSGLVSVSGGQTQAVVTHGTPRGTQFSGEYTAAQTQVSLAGGVQEGRSHRGMHLLLDPDIIFATIDRNNDGQITRSEFEAAVLGAEVMMPSQGPQE